MNVRSLRTTLVPLDVISIVFLTFLSALNVLFLSRIPEWALLIALNTGVSVAIVFLARAAAAHPGKILRGLHRWYCYPIVLIVFKEIYLMVHPIYPVDHDALLIAADRWLFGVDPTVWMARFASPLLTEILQIAYFSYYILFILIGVELYRRFPIEEFDHGAFLIVYGFYLSYLGYFLLPAVGPRFTLHDFYALPRELPGLWLTSWMRDFVNAGESISFAMPDAMARVQRDVFPSGHTQMTMIVTYLAFRYRVPTRWIIAVCAFLLIVATVYLRYHYVVDLIGGVAMFFVTVWTGRWIERWWDRMKATA